MFTIACLAGLVALMAAVISFFWAVGTIQKHTERMQEAIDKKVQSSSISPQVAWPSGGGKENDGHAVQR